MTRSNFTIPPLPRNHEKEKEGGEKGRELREVWDKEGGGTGSVESNGWVTPALYHFSWCWILNVTSPSLSWNYSVAPSQGSLTRLWVWLTFGRLPCASQLNTPPPTLIFWIKPLLFYLSSFIFWLWLFLLLCHLTLPPAMPSYLRSLVYHWIYSRVFLLLSIYFFTPVFSSSMSIFH